MIIIIDKLQFYIRYFTNAVVVESYVERKISVSTLER